MKIRYKFLIGIGIIIIGVAAMNYYSYKDYMNKQKERIELFFKYNYNNIESITFTKVDKTPIGALVLYGYFNDDKENEFSADIMPYQKEFENNNAMNGKFARANAKFENGKTYTVSEIEKIQRKERREKREESSDSWFSDTSKASGVNNYLNKF